MFTFLKRHKGRKIFVVGLDCAEPSLVFERWQNQLPNFRRLMDRGPTAP